MLRAEGQGGLVTFVMFDEQTEEFAARLGLRVAHPPAQLRHRLDSKIVTTQLGNAAGVPSVLNVLGRAASDRELLALAAAAELGSDLVVQMPYGDSGKTTFFVRTEADWDTAAAKEPLAPSSSRSCAGSSTGRSRSLQTSVPVRESFKMASTAGSPAQGRQDRGSQPGRDLGPVSGAGSA